MPADLGLLTSTYFLSFAAFQLPLEILLDRYGPRRVESALLLFAAAGAGVFALAQGLGGLLLGRALIGFGVSACLMAAFKAFTLWFPSERLPWVNGWIMTAGGLGALTATSPVESALALTDWRGVFLGLSAATFAVAALVFLVVPDQAQRQGPLGLHDQLRGVRTIFTNRFFWRVAPLATLSQASFLSIQGLWAGPWLRDVAALERPELASHLFGIALAMVAGYLLMGTFAWRLARVGVAPLAVAISGMSIFMLAEAALTLQIPGPVLPTWVVFGFFGTSGILTYAVLSQSFPSSLAGRANTALTLLVFVAAFLGQWGMGAVIGQWPHSPELGYHPQGYQAAFGISLLLQILALLWFVRGGRAGQ